MSRVRILAALLVATYVGIFMWANMHRTHVYYWPSEKAIIPLLWYTEEKVDGEQAAREAAAVAEPELAAEHGVRPEERRAVARPVPVFLLIFASFATGFLGSWVLSVAVLARERMRRQRLAKQHQELQAQLDALQKVPPPAPQLAAVTEVSGNGQ